MKHILLILPLIIGYTIDSNVVVEPTIQLDLKEARVDEVTEVKSDLNPLIEAMIMVESRGNDSAYCKREQAAGCLQIRPIMLKECNRILKLQNSNISYTLTDRWSRKKSIEIFKIVSNYHHKNANYEEIARAWNGGPKWAQKSATQAYWNKVQQELRETYEHFDNRFASI